MPMYFYGPITTIPFVNNSIPSPIWWFKYDTGDNTGTTLTNYGSAGTSATLTNTALMSTTSPAVGTGCLYYSPTNASLQYIVTFPSFNLSSYTYLTFPGITISFWAKNGVDSQWGRFFNFADTPTYIAILMAPYGGTYNNCSALSFQILYGNGTSGVKSGISSLTTLPPNIFGSTSGGAWHHIVITIPGGVLNPTVIVYIDNTAYTYSNHFGAGNTIALINYTYCVQGTDTNTLIHDSYTDDFRMYNYVLTPSQISSIYNKTA